MTDVEVKAVDATGTVVDATLAEAHVNEASKVMVTVEVEVEIEMLRL